MVKASDVMRSRRSESCRSDSYLVAMIGELCLTVGKTTLCGGGIGKRLKELNEGVQVPTGGGNRVQNNVNCTYAAVQSERII